MKARNILILLAGLLTLPLYFGGCAVDRWEAYAGRTQTDRWIDDTMRVWYYWKQDIPHTNDLNYFAPPFEFFASVLSEQDEQYRQLAYLVDYLGEVVNVMPGSGELMLTGQMGDVMKESAQTGISYIRSVSGRYGIAEDFFEKHDIHVHIPEGAVPKDGPSAGITMATAMLSAVTGKKVRADLAMTGEITLRGRVLPIGGLKEQLLAAKSAGIKTVLIPKENRVDAEELSSEITKGLEILPVENMEEVLKQALADTPEETQETAG